MEIPRMGLPDHLASRLSMAEQHELLRKNIRVSRRGMLVAGAAGAGGNGHKRAALNEDQA
ncbi:hypothetical protein AB0M46_49565 [Dactylosporangium sp. NPDC051485]|uniref:hypothetical protein n=1 Tax=Dactylosporangium sp. NPDC051485 TaxID=3154846 RepID=UPI003437F47C